MDLRKLKTLIDLVSDSNVSELEITEAEGKVRIVKSSPQAAPMAMNAVQYAAAPVANVPAPAPAPVAAEILAAEPAPLSGGPTQAAGERRQAGDMRHTVGGAQSVDFGQRVVQLPH